MPLKCRFSRWWIAVLPAGVFLLVWTSLATRSQEPVYQGRRLGSWLRGHPKEYYPAVLAVGTNALPYLLAELQATDSGPSRWGESLLAKVSMGPFWRTARNRCYHARLGLQILDTNAVPTLLNRVFSEPMRIVESDPSWSAAAVLGWLATPTAQHMAEERLAVELAAPDPAHRRNACLALSLWQRTNDVFVVALATLSRDTNATVRAAALRAMLLSVWREEVFLPVVTSRLEDEQASVRRLAIAALSLQKSNVVVALPALHAAYSNELVQSSLRGDLGDGYYGAHEWSAREIRGAIRDAIRGIDPNGPLPADPP
jgi:hypothetical protein